MAAMEEIGSGKRIGVVAVQGAFVEHIASLHQLGVECVQVRLPRDLEELDGLVIPGGESTTISHLMAAYALLGPIRELAARGLPILGTCAGMILLARRAIGLNSATLGVMDIEVQRNAFGRQVNSFETLLPIPALGSDPFPAVFIRAPLISFAQPWVDILARLPDGTPVAARQGGLLGAAFHPELTTDLRFHSFFLEEVCGVTNQGALADRECGRSKPRFRGGHE